MNKEAEDLINEIVLLILKNYLQNLLSLFNLNQIQNIILKNYDFIFLLINI